MLEEYKYLISEESNGITIDNVENLREIESILRKVFNKYNFKEILVPLFEYVELYKNVYADFNEEKAFKYIGKDGKVIALRWDFTIPIARHYFLQNINKEARYSYFGKVYRKEQAYKGRSSESYQAGIELINKPSIKGDIECLNILQDSLDNIKMSDLKLELGSAKIFNRLCNLVGDKHKLIEILSKKNISEMEKFILNNNDLSKKLKEFLILLPRLCGDIKMLDNIIENMEDEVILNALKQLRKIYDNIKNKKVKGEDLKC